DVLAAQLEAPRIVEADGANLLDDLVERGRGPTLPIARRLRLARRRHELRMPAVEEERQIGMAAPGLDAPRNDGVEIPRSPAIVHRPLRDIRLGVDAELPPLLRDHR